MYINLELGNSIFLFLIAVGIYFFLIWTYMKTQTLFFKKNNTGRGLTQISLG